MDIEEDINIVITCPHCLNFVKVIYFAMVF